MLMSVVVFAIWVFCLVDVIGTDEVRMRHLPKLGWLLVVILLPFVGSIAWLALGRPEGPARPTAVRTPGFPEYERPGRFIPQDSTRDEEFLAQVRARAEEQRRRYEEQRKRDQGGGPQG
jgi:hypothetical protein